MTNVNIDALFETSVSLVVHTRRAEISDSYVAGDKTGREKI